MGISKVLTFAMPLLCLTSLVSAQPLILRPATLIPARLTTPLSTKVQRSGELFTANLDRDLVVNGQLVARRGAPLQGIVANSSKGGRVRGRASLALRLTSIRLANGHTAHVNTYLVTRTARATKRKDAAKIGGATGAGAAIGAIAGGGIGAGVGAAIGAGAGTGTVLLTRGDQVGFRGESLVTFRLSAPLQVR